jgi:hypothetical protein
MRRRDFVKRGGLGIATLALGSLPSLASNNIEVLFEVYEEGRKELNNESFDLNGIPVKDMGRRIDFNRRKLKALAENVAISKFNIDRAPNCMLFGFMDEGRIIIDSRAIEGLRI